MEPSEIQALCERLTAGARQWIVGQERAVRLLLVALLSDGHVLLEGPPGTAKTMLARAFAQGLSLDFGRVQFTPDLMPGDILGTNIYDFESQSFRLTRGPIFTQLLLADEINRTPPKTQAALLEAMEERAVTIDGTRHDLGAGFMVIATQNPIEQEGTYPLPEAQLDRFLFKVLIAYPDRAQELEMTRLHATGRGTMDERLADIEAVAGLDEIERARDTVAGYHVTEEIAAYAVDLVRATREHPGLACGGSPRSINRLLAAGKAHAVTDGRQFVIPDDVKALFVPAMRHRVILAPGAEIEGTTADRILGQVIGQVPAPR